MNQPSLIEEHDDAMSISALYDRVEVAIARAFPKRRSMWVRGEIQSITDRTGHCYMDLVDPDGVRDRQSPVLKVKCWRTSWEPMSLSLSRQGVTLEAGMVVVIRGTLDFYKPRAELGFLLNEIDVAALLGRLAQRRAALLEVLRTEGLLGRNRQLAVPAVPLRIGLVASHGTEGHNDFAGQLIGSGFAFDVVLARASVQGTKAASSIAGALVALAGRGCDLAVIVRGGGSKADLASFDSEAVARAIAMMPIPVWVGIGHTGDQSVADIVANRSFVTPTECGQELVSRVSTWWEGICTRALVLSRRSHEVLDSAAHNDDVTRRRLARCALQQLKRHSEHLRTRSERIVRMAPRQVETSASHVFSRADRIGSLANLAVDRQGERVDASRRLIGAYDVDRQLERGYTLTLDSEGRLLRSASALQTNDAITTRFADGRAHSTVQGIEVREQLEEPKSDSPDSGTRQV